MDSDLKKSFNRLKEEIEKDIYFFGSCGFTVGFLLIWQSRLKEFGGFENLKLASDLFSDFLSGDAFGFIFFIYILIGTVANKVTRKSEKLKIIILHLNDRLRQTGSSIISFSIGFSIFIFIFSVINAEPSTFILFFTVILFSIFIAAAIIMAELLVRPEKIFDRYLFAVIFIFYSCIFLIRQIGS